MAKSEPRYDAGYPLAIELVYAQRLGDNARLVGKWVRDACIKTYKAIGKSGAVLNPLMTCWVISSPPQRSKKCAYI